MPRILSYTGYALVNLGALISIVSSLAGSKLGQYVGSALIFVGTLLIIAKMILSRRIRNSNGDEKANSTVGKSAQ